MIEFGSGRIRAQTVDYNSIQAEYEQLTTESRSSSLHVLHPTSATRDNMVNVTDSDDLPAPKNFFAPDTVLAFYKYFGSDAVNDNTVSITDGNVYGVYLNLGVIDASGNTIILSGDAVRGRLRNHCYDI